MSLRLTLIIIFWSSVTVRKCLSDRSLNGDSGHQSLILLRSDQSGFITIPRPLESVAFGKPKGIHSHSDPFKADPANPIALVSAEEIEDSFFEWIQFIVKSHVGCQSIHSAPKINPAAADNDPRESSSVFKHLSAPEAPCGACSRLKDDSLSLYSRSLQSEPEQILHQKSQQAMPGFPDIL